MRKIWVVASREYNAAVRTKAFLVSLLIMPIVMATSIGLQLLFKDVADVEDKRFVVVDRAGRPDVVAALHVAVQVHNDLFVGESGERTKPRFILEETPAEDDYAETRLKLSGRVRAGELMGFVEILTNEQAKLDKPSPVVLRYFTNRPTYMEFSKLAEKAVEAYLRDQLAQKAGGLDKTLVDQLVKPVELEQKGLVTRDASGAIDEGEETRFTSLIVPAGLMVLMFMVVLMGATPLMQGVVEEKMQRIAEVLLGSVRPFELMLGKLLGMTAVSLTIAAVYLAGGFWASERFGLGVGLTLDLIVWFAVFQLLASLMFGALFIAIGAACTEMKETQTMVLPVMLLATIPMFLLGTVLQAPNGPVARAFSFFPFTAPALMIGRLAMPPGPAWWEAPLVILMLISMTLLCVYIAGRIFRVGILMQGKGANVRQILRWIVKG